MEFMFFHLELNVFLLNLGVMLFPTSFSTSFSESEQFPLVCSIQSGPINL